ncbi:plant/F20B17-9 protein [Senna tora]|uniref:Plant/F20B17-9 protein n=1 Tax=Senna tora TaxID=362788 RepID=A0A834WNF4_9FABA|nr:plant/F20B17-9 protein [Senna tora]
MTFENTKQQFPIEIRELKFNSHVRKKSTKTAEKFIQHKSVKKEEKARNHGDELRKVVGKAMVLDSILSSPHHLGSPSFKRRRDELGSWSTLVRRHRFLLTALVLLTFLCTVYLYFAMTFESISPCTGFTGARKVSCHLKHAKSSIGKSKG